MDQNENYYERWFEDIEDCIGFLNQMGYAPKNGRVARNGKIVNVSYGQVLTWEQAEQNQDGLTSVVQFHDKDSVATLRDFCLLRIEGFIGHHDSMSRLATDTIVTLTDTLRSMGWRIAQSNRLIGDLELKLKEKEV